MLCVRYTYTFILMNLITQTNMVSVYLYVRSTLIHYIYCLSVRMYIFNSDSISWQSLFRVHESCIDIILEYLLSNGDGVTMKILNE